MTRRNRRTGCGSPPTRAAVLAVAVLAAAAAGARGEFTETRFFTVSVDGNPAGQTQLTIQDRDDGTTVVASQASIKIKILITYAFEHQVTEVWKGPQLLQLDSKCDATKTIFDKQGQYAVQARPDAQAGQGYALYVNGQEQRLEVGHLWTTSFWKLPDQQYFNKPVTVLQSDKGKVLGGVLQYVATEDIAVGGQPVKSYHFKLNDPDAPVDLWFDAHHRLIRRESVERGHRTVLELTAIKR